MKKLFKNRITQETETTMRELRSTYIELKSPISKDTPNGFWSITLQPNCYIDETTLERTFKHILSRYYRWKFGSKYLNIKKKTQTYFKGIIERQNGYNHIHITMYLYNVAETAILLGYIWKWFKYFYPKASHKFKQVYDLKRWEDYCAETSSKDNLVSKRRDIFPIMISSDLFQ